MIDVSSLGSWNFFCLIFIGGSLIYNVVLVSGVQQGNSVIYVCKSTLLSFRFFCSWDFWRILKNTSTSIS